MHRLLLSVLLAFFVATPAFADDFGAGYAVPTIDTAAAIGRDVMTREIGLEVLRKEQGGGAVRTARSAASASPRSSLFASAVDARPGVTVSPAQTTFQRTPQGSLQAKQNILAALAKRQPDAVDDYRKVFAKTDLGLAFEAVTKGYGLRADDVADAMTAYWAMAWVIANQTELPSPRAIAAARAQVAQGIGMTAVGDYDPVKRHVLADEAIFNFLLLNQTWRNEKGGANYDRLSEATQQNFLPLGADLRKLDLGPQGFAER